MVNIKWILCRIIFVLLFALLVGIVSSIRAGVQKSGRSTFGNIASVYLLWALTLRIYFGTSGRSKTQSLHTTIVS